MLRWHRPRAHRQLTASRQARLERRQAEWDALTPAERGIFRRLRRPGS